MANNDVPVGKCYYNIDSRSCIYVDCSWSNGKKRDQTKTPMTFVTVSDLRIRPYSLKKSSLSPSFSLLQLPLLVYENLGHSSSTSSYDPSTNVQLGAANSAL